MLVRHPICNNRTEQSLQTAHVVALNVITVLRHVMLLQVTMMCRNVQVEVAGGA